MSRLLILLCTVLALQGCAAALVAGGIGAAASAHDRRSLGTQIDDQTLGGRIALKLSEDKQLEQHAHVYANVFNGIVLLVGQAPTDNMRSEAEKIVKGIPNIRKLYNQIRIAQPTTAGTRTDDVWLASKVKAQLVADKGVDGLNIDVVVEDSIVYLMGMVKEKEGAKAVDIARNVNGISRVVKAFEYIN